MSTWSDNITSDEGSITSNNRRRSARILNADYKMSTLSDNIASDEGSFTSNKRRRSARILNAAYRNVEQSSQRSSESQTDQSFNENKRVRKSSLQLKTPYVINMEVISTEANEVTPIMLSGTLPNFNDDEEFDEMLMPPIPRDLLFGTIIKKTGKVWLAEVDVSENLKITLDINQKPRHLMDGDLFACRILNMDDNKNVSISISGPWLGIVNQALVIKVDPSRIGYMTTKIVKLACGLKIVLTLNGYIWIAGGNQKFINNNEKDFEEFDYDTCIMRRMRLTIAAILASTVLIQEESLEVALDECCKYNLKELEDPDKLQKLGNEINNQLVELTVANNEKKFLKVRFSRFSSILK